MTFIKNCGLKSIVELETAARSGAGFAGFIHHATSPRHLPLSEMAALNMQKPATLKSVTVTVNPTDALLDDITTMVKPDFIQLHKVDAARAAMISERTHIPLIIAVSMGGAEDLKHVALLEQIAAHILLDTKLDGVEGGSGVPFDWTFLKGAQFKKLWFLAGGLTAENVGEAIRITHAPMVDVSSGIEDRPGHKSLEKIAAFNKAVLATY